MSGRFPVTAASILAGLAICAHPARAQIGGGDFSVDLPQIVTSSPANMSGGEWGLDPGAGSPNLGEPMEGGEWSLGPGGPPIVLVPLPLALLDLSGAHAYPVPFRPSLGHTKITFSGLTQSVAVTVYTSEGEKVRSLNKDDSLPDMDWNPVSNDRGEQAASGLYLFIIRNSLTGEKKFGKLIIIR